MAELEIFGVPFSNYVWSCRIVAGEKGVPVKLHDLRPQSPEMLAINPLGKVPAMRHGDVVLFESAAICSYIDKAFPGPALQPKDPAGAARVDQWVSVVNTSIDPVMLRQYGLGYFFPGTPDGSPDRVKIDAALLALKKMFGILEARLGQSKFLAGDQFSIADAILFPVLFYMKRPPESAALLVASPHVAAWLETVGARASVKAAAPPPPPKK